ncbi:unnamed protein product, partial [Rotaria magnacalcarata]
MPRLSRRRIRLNKSIKMRWSMKKIVIDDHSSDEDFKIDSNEMIVDDNLKDIDWTNDQMLNHIGDLFKICINQCSLKTLSTFIYIVLKYFNFTWRDIDNFMCNIGAMRCITANKWAGIFVNGDFDAFMDDGRGGKRGDSLFDEYPELETEAKLFVTDACSKKSSGFKAMDLANFIDSSYYTLLNTNKCQNELIRSERMCRLDLRRWGIFFIQKNHYYLVAPGDHLDWLIPTQKPRILICHDESTFRSGEMTSRRWMSNETAPFFSKGRGRSLMLSDFMVCHPSGPFFYLNENEWHKTITKYPDLLQNNDINYIDRTSTAAINVGADAYFDNETVLSQFHRLFKMLEFKTDYKDHDIDILVDNARTHTARQYNLNDFGKNIGSRCPVDVIEHYDENDIKKTIQCFFSSGPHQNKSKGLLQLAKELNIILPAKCSLSQLRELLSEDPAFQTKTKLENLAKTFNINIIYSPKFHCELNPIEGLWCNMKRFVRQRNDQQYNTMVLLIEQSRDHFVNIDLYKKLFRRFWQTCEAYRD